MDHSYWHKQGTEPLFPDLLWSRPENKRLAGKLLIVGGHAHGFAAPAEAYAEAERAGIGTVRVLLPDQLRAQLLKFQGPSLNTEFAPSTPSGSFSTKALAELLDFGSWADGILLAGDLGRNSETAILLEKFTSKISQPLVITKDAVDYFASSPLALLNRQSTCLALSIAQLQKIAIHAKFTTPITFGMDLLHLIQVLHDFTNAYACYIITQHHNQFVIAADGQVSTTKTDSDIEDLWRVQTAAKASVFWIQNLGKPFQALTTAIHTP